MLGVELLDGVGAEVGRPFHGIPEAVPAPSRNIAGKTTPHLVFALAGSDIVHAVDGGRAAENFTARPAGGARVAGSILQLGLIGGEVLPVEVGTHGRLEVGIAGDEQRFIVVVARVTCFNHGDGHVWVFRETTCERQTSSSTTGDDIVKDLVRHSGV